jgi:signal transduction histidine kinase
MGFTTVFLGLETDPAYINRVASGGILVLVWASLVTVLVDSGKRQLQIIEDLEQKNLHLISSREKSLETLKTYTAEVFAKTNKVITESFDSITRSLKLTHNLESAQISKSLYNLVDDVVRPLSQEIVLSEPRFEQRSSNIAIKPTWSSRFYNFKFTLNNLTLVEPFGTQITPWIVLLTGLPTFALNSTAFETLIFVLSVLSTSYVGYELANRFLRSSLTKVALPWRVLFVLTIWVSAAATAGFICSNIPGVEQIMPRMALTFTGIMFLSSLLSAVLIAQRQSLKILEKDLTTTNAAIQWNIDRLNQSLSVEKKKISLLLHGDIQSQIVSVALNLQDKSDLKESDFDSILENLQTSCVQALTVEKTLTDPLLILDSIVQVWRSNVQIALNYSVETISRLKFDAVATFAVIEIVREAISNAVKHGNSTKIRIDLAIDLDANLRIEVLNNGLTFTKPKTPGFGLVVFDELTRKWNIANTDEGVCLTATVALSS